MKEQKINKKIYGLILTLFAVITIFSAAKETSAQSKPNGSYMQTCKSVSVVSDITLHAECKTVNGLWNWTQLDNIFLCTSDISNNNGTLVCDQSVVTQQFKTAYEAFSSAMLVFFGRPLKGIGKDKGSELLRWVRGVHMYGMKDKYQQGLNFSDAMTVLKKEATYMQQFREEIINNALMQVYGEVDSGKAAYWDGQIKEQKAWFAPIVFAEKFALNKNETERTAMVHRVYKAAMGRLADETNRGYWVPRTEDYSQVLEANRNWLYSDRGTEDLRATAKKAYQVKNGNAPDANQLDSMITLLKATGKKMIYAEMIK